MEDLRAETVVKVMVLIYLAELDLPGSTILKINIYQNTYPASGRNYRASVWRISEHGNTQMERFLHQS